MINYVDMDFVSGSSIEVTINVGLFSYSNGQTKLINIQGRAEEYVAEDI
jgi:hypothetical protein